MKHINTVAAPKLNIERQAQMRRMPLQPQSAQDELHGGQPKLRAESCRFGKRRRQII
ncbi:MAG: hypothetical protein ACLU1U_06985 [Lachnospiraceae bacterium]